MTSGWFRWRRVEDATDRGRELVEVAWLDVDDTLQLTVVRACGPQELEISSGTEPDRITESVLLGALASELALAAVTPSRALWEMDRRRPGDPLDARIRICQAMREIIAASVPP